MCFLNKNDMNNNHSQSLHVVKLVYVRNITSLFFFVLIFDTGPAFNLFERRIC